MAKRFQGTLAVMIRTAGLAFALATVALPTSGARAEQRAGGAIGVGVSLGDPTGVTAEYHRRTPGFGQALELSVGVEAFNRADDFYVHLIWKFYITEVVRHSDFDVPVYTGIGPWISEDNGRDDDDNPDIGARLPLGIAMDFRRAPLQVFFELAAEVQLLDDFGIDLEGAIGFRYFF